MHSDWSDVDGGAPRTTGADSDTWGHDGYKELYNKKSGPVKTTGKKQSLVMPGSKAGLKEKLSGGIRKPGLKGGDLRQKIRSGNGATKSDLRRKITIGSGAGGKAKADLRHRISGGGGSGTDLRQKIGGNSTRPGLPEKCPW